MNEKRETCFFTGASGYIGSSLLDVIKPCFSKIVLLKRNAQEDNPLELSFHLGQSLDCEVFQQCDVLIHCSYDFSLNTWEEIEKININGTLTLIDNALDSGVKKIIYISSVAASPHARGLYGQAKYILEQKLMEKPEVIIIRPGMVFGGENQGTFKSMENWVKNLPIIPMIVPSCDLFACHINDLTSFIKEVFEHNYKGTFFAGCRSSMSFRDLLNLIQKKYSTNKLIIPIPWWIPWSMFRLMESVGISSPFRSDAIKGIISPCNISENTIDTRIKVKFRNFDDVDLN